MQDRISITMLDDGIADVRLIRTDKMNALDGAMWEALAAAVDQLKATAGLRVVVLSGDRARRRGWRDRVRRKKRAPRPTARRRAAPRSP